MRTAEMAVRSRGSSLNPRTDAPGTPSTTPGWSPFRERRIEIDDRPIRYVDEGGGPILLFVHTGVGSFPWRDVIVRLRDRFRCVALDAPGFTPPSILESFVRTLDLNDVTLVVHGLGGPFALGLAPRLDDRIRALVVVESFDRPLREETREPVPGDRPVLLVFGEGSPAVRAGAPERWRERFPDAGLLLVEGARRFPMTDAPDVVARAIKGWWREEVLAG